MRLVSRDGGADVPYQDVVLTVKECEDCYKIFAWCPTIKVELMSFDTLEQALKAMEEVRDANCDGMIVFHF